MPLPKTNQVVTVNLDKWDDGLRDIMRQITGAPKGAHVIFTENGVTVRWTRRRKCNA
jgi:hypothetical protein